MGWGGEPGHGCRREIRASWARPVPAWSPWCLKDAGLPGCRVARRSRSAAGKVRGASETISLVLGNKAARLFSRKTISELN